MWQVCICVIGTCKTRYLQVWISLLLLLLLHNHSTTHLLGKCTGISDELDMINVCKHIGIKHVAVDFVKEYWNEVFIPFIDAYKGEAIIHWFTPLLIHSLTPSFIGGYRTPNPDIACNKHIKFNYLKKFCNEKLGIHALATGHYAQLGTDSNGNLAQSLTHLLAHSLTDYITQETLN